MNPRKRFLTVFAPLAAIVLGIGCGHDAAKHEAPDLEPISVRTAAVEASADRTAFEVRGVVHPARRATVSSRVTGPVVQLHVRSGGQVRQGQALLEIEPEASQGQLAQAEGALAQARAGLAVAERNYQRYQALHAENAASDLELDMARMQFEQAEGAVEQAQGAVTTAATVAQESTVKAPFAGQVVETMVEVGDLAAPGRPLVQLETVSGQQIWLTVPAADIMRIEPGDSVPVRIDARPDLGTVNGTVLEIVPSADAATHTFTVKVALGDENIRSGLSGRAFITGDMAERLLIPAEAVHRRGGLELVVVRAEDGTARTRAVTTGSQVDGLVEVLSGLDAGETVAVDVPGPVTDGTPLEIAR
jgi:RND family efflux transporter MFP subunit